MRAEEIMLELMKINSYSKRENEMAQFLLKEIKKYGHDVEMEISDVMNVVVNGGEKLVVATHMDTINREMETRVENGRIYGRGASDAKASIASILLFLEKVKQLNFSIAFLSDEEEDAKGSQFYLNKHKPEMAIVMEPTSLKVCNHQAGSIEAFFEIRNEETHGSFCGSVIDKTIEMIKELQELEYWKKGKYFESCFTIQEIKSINPYYLNPKTCNGRLEVRLIPEQNAAEVAGKIEEIVGKYGHIEFRERWNGFKIDENEEIIKKAENACKMSGIPFSLDGMPSWTDAIIFNENGVKCIIFGPGNLKYSHTENEYIEIKEIEIASQFLEALNELMGKEG